MLIDAHHHLWHYNARDYVWMTDAHAALRRDFLIFDLSPAEQSSIGHASAVAAYQLGPVA